MGKLVTRATDGRFGASNRHAVGWIRGSGCRRRRSDGGVGDNPTIHRRERELVTADDAVSHGAFDAILACCHGGMCPRVRAECGQRK